MESTREHIAHHEAAHAVAHLRTGLKFKWVNIIPVAAKRRGGRCETDLQANFGEYETYEELCSRLSAEQREQMALIQLVGPAVDERFQLGTAGGAQDHANVPFWLTCGPPNSVKEITSDRLEQHSARILDDARDFVANPGNWVLIE